MSETIIHNDEPTNKDRLDRDKYAEAFARLSETCQTPLVIGLYGGWGVGKTSLMQLIEEKVDPAKARTVFFESWQHQHDDNPALSLLHKVVDAFDMQEEGKKLLTVIAGAFGSVLLKATTNLNINDVDALGKRFEEERFQVREACMRLREHFGKLIEKAQGKPKKRIIFFIDDLDRCLPAATLSLLESLKLYLNLDECVYFLGVDKDALEQSINFHYKEQDLNEIDYLDKIIQLPFTIPPIAPEAMKGFIEPLLTGELTDCAKLLVEGLDYNPRQSKRFINTLTLNHQLAIPLKIDKYNPKVLALLLLIQVRSPRLYRAITRRPEYLSKIKAGDEATKKALEKDAVHIDRLKEILPLVSIPESKILKRYIHLTEMAGIKKTAPTEKNILDLNLDKVLEKHELWVESNGKKGIRANLSGFFLDSPDLSGAILSEAHLRNTNLSNAGLSNVDLSGADLNGADLSGADLSGADLSGADLSGADLSGADLCDADLEGAYLACANLSRANLSNANLNSASMSEANLSNANLSNADLTYTVLDGTNLNRADLSGVNLNGANLGDVINLTKEMLASAITDGETILPDFKE